MKRRMWRSTFYRKGAKTQRMNTMDSGIIISTETNLNSLRNFLSAFAPLRLRKGGFHLTHATNSSHLYTIIFFFLFIHSSFAQYPTYKAVADLPAFKKQF